MWPSVYQRVPRTLQGRVRVPRALHGHEGLESFRKVLCYPLVTPLPIGTVTVSRGEPNDGRGRRPTPRWRALGLGSRPAYLGGAAEASFSLNSGATCLSSVIAPRRSSSKIDPITP